ncbi:MAG: hypothetical protein QOK07_2032, partial [Gemmatimonadaceae bacterium]|nr:hypothetical protein [Gemmatimonadaceae bacterium]
RMGGGSLVAGEWDEASESKSWYELPGGHAILLRINERIDKPSAGNLHRQKEFLGAVCAELRLDRLD